MSHYQLFCHAVVFLFWVSLQAANGTLALTLCIVKMTNCTQLHNSPTTERVKPEKAVVLKTLEIYSILHIVPTLCCIVTAAETLTPPLLLFAISQSFYHQGW